MHIKGDPAVSERHGAIAWTADGWTLTDVGSSNGTLVNGERLEPNGGASNFCGRFSCTFSSSAWHSAGAGRLFQAQLVIAVSAGAAKVLKDGDIVQFGTDTKVRVEVSAGGCCATADGTRSLYHAPGRLDTCRLNLQCIL